VTVRLNLTFVFYWLSVGISSSWLLQFFLIKVLPANQHDGHIHCNSTVLYNRVDGG
jgi:hypothetical protein